MYFINPFKGLRPTKENASSVAVSSTDHLSKDSVVDHKNNNSWSYLNVFGEKDNSKSKEQFELMKEKSILIKDKKNNICIKQRPGDMLILDNYRILHGRGAYRDTKNRRYFRQGYMDRDIFQSKLKTLAI